jgi:predicted XRE-type DNA-binding protein
MAEECTDAFVALGFSPEEAANLRIRSTMMRTITDHIRAKHLTRSQAATLFSVPQRRIADLLHGKLSLFSIEDLSSLLTTAGIEAEAVIKKTRHP